MSLSNLRTNQCLSAATSCLYGVTEAAVLAACYAPAIGFVHSGKPLLFVYDTADIVKLETVVPVAFRIAARNPHLPDRQVRQANHKDQKKAISKQRPPSQLLGKRT